MEPPVTKTQSNVFHKHKERAFSTILSAVFDLFLLHRNIQTACDHTVIIHHHHDDSQIATKRANMMYHNNNNNNNNILFFYSVTS